MDAETIQQSTMYAAAKDSIVSGKTGDSCFEKMVEVANYLQPKEFMKHCDEIEAQIKKDFDIPNMSNAWRSAKSVIKTALVLGIAIKGRGKTSLQNEIKQVKAAAKEPLTNVDKYINSYNKTNQLWSILTDEERLSLAGKY